MSNSNSNAKTWADAMAADHKMRDMVRHWVRIHAGDAEVTARWIRRTLHVSRSLAECRELVHAALAEPMAGNWPSRYSDPEG